MKIENWYIERVAQGGYWICGNIYGNPKFEDGKFLHSSLLKSVDFVTNTCVTMNSTYVLGEAK